MQIQSYARDRSSPARKNSCDVTLEKQREKDCRGRRVFLSWNNIDLLFTETTSISSFRWTRRLVHDDELAWRAHLLSSNCGIDSRWTLRRVFTDCGKPCCFARHSASLCLLFRCEQYNDYRRNLWNNLTLCTRLSPFRRHYTLNLAEIVRFWIVKIFASTDNHNKRRYDVILVLCFSFMIWCNTIHFKRN